MRLCYGKTVIPEDYSSTGQQSSSHCDVESMGSESQYSITDEPMDEEDRETVNKVNNIRNNIIENVSCEVIIRSVDFQL